MSDQVRTGYTCTNGTTWIGHDVVWCQSPWDSCEGGATGTKGTHKTSVRGGVQPVQNSIPGCDESNEQKLGCGRDTPTFRSCGKPHDGITPWGCCP